MVSGSRTVHKYAPALVFRCSIVATRRPLLESEQLATVAAGPHVDR
jgi:hypothetical protein